MGASACLPADGGLEDKIRSDREHVMGEDTEDNTVPNHRNFLKSKMLILIQVTNAITKFAIFFFFCLVRVGLVHGGVQFVLKPECIKLVIGN